MKNSSLKNTLLKIVKSKNKNKKLDAIFLINGKEKTISFGAAGYKDYAIYYKEDGSKKANERKSLYYARHSKEDWTKPFTAGTLSKYILWNKPTLSQSISSYKKAFSI